MPFLGSPTPQHWIAQPGVPDSQLLDGSKIDSAFHLPWSIKWLPGTPGDLVVQSKLFSYGGSVAASQLNSIHKKGPQFFLYLACEPKPYIWCSDCKIKQIIPTRLKVMFLKDFFYIMHARFTWIFTPLHFKGILDLTKFAKLWFDIFISFIKKW